VHVLLSPEGLRLWSRLFSAKEWQACGKPLLLEVVQAGSCKATLEPNEQHEVAKAALLRMAVWSGRLEAVRLLLGVGSMAQGALNLAVHRQHVGCVSLVLASGGRVTAQSLSIPLLQLLMGARIEHGRASRILEVLVQDLETVDKYTPAHIDAALRQKTACLLADASLSVLEVLQWHPHVSLSVRRRASSLVCGHSHVHDQVKHAGAHGDAAPSLQGVDDVCDDAKGHACCLEGV
jgi:hypothetical protein